MLKALRIIITVRIHHVVQNIKIIYYQNLINKFKFKYYQDRNKLNIRKKNILIITIIIIIWIILIIII